MKCPYAVHRFTVTQTAFEYADDGNVTTQTTVDNNKALLIDCLQKCMYNKSE